MASTLRLPAELEQEARDRCQRLGISLNALVCVALDAYLRQPAPAAPETLNPTNAPSVTAVVQVGRKERRRLEALQRGAAR